MTRRRHQARIIQADDHADERMRSTQQVAGELFADEVRGAYRAQSIVNADAALPASDALPKARTRSS